MNYIIITSINEITDAVLKYSKFLNWHTIIVGDVKSKKYFANNITFLDIEEQGEFNFLSVKTTPVNHYSRKNIGYLYAMNLNAELIYDTDDDTFPYENWNFRNFKCDNVVSGHNMINPYTLFTNKKVWPRGFHLGNINKSVNINYTNDTRNVGVWQGLIDGDSDFDAIYRLVDGGHIKYDIKNDVVIEKLSFSPFNTQSTLWNKKFNTLMYIPITVDFRFTDILRGYIAQRIMWDYDHYLGFHSPNTYQIRNEHDYFKDFIGELSMYKSVPDVIKILSGIKLSNENLGSDLLQIYKNLIKFKIVEKKELINLENWISDISTINKNTL